MKKCALFLICLFALASCSKEVEMAKTVSNDDLELEATIENGFEDLINNVQNYFQGFGKKDLDSIKSRLESGATLTEIDQRFAAETFQRLQLNLVNNFRSLSYYNDSAQLEAFIDQLVQNVTAKGKKVANVDGTPCFDAWDLQMATVTATAVVCLAYSSPDLISISRCGALVAIGTIAAEIAYQNCMDQYE